MTWRPTLLLALLHVGCSHYTSTECQYGNFDRSAQRSCQRPSTPSTWQSSSSTPLDTLSGLSAVWGGGGDERKEEKSTDGLAYRRHRVLYLRGGVNLRGNPKGPKAGLKPQEGDLTVHLPSRTLPPPHHRCLKSALHRTKTDRWTGRRVYVRSSYIDDKETAISRYGWKGPIRIGDMKFGSGNESVAHITGDDEVQIWGQWHFGGRCIGLFQGLYTMFTEYGPYKILMLVERKADVLMEQCEIRCFGGKCIVGRYFAEVTLCQATVGGSSGSQATPNHKKLQIWKPELEEMVTQRELARLERRQAMRKSGRYEKPVTRQDVDLSKHWAPGGSRHASDGISMESGAWLQARRVCIEDTGRAGGIALRCVGHSRATLLNCRFQRNMIDLAADATAVLTLDHCHEFYYDEDKKGTRGYKGERTEFHAHRALRLPGNGTSVLEAQDPSGGDVMAWREVTPTTRYWTDQTRRGVDPNKQAKRIRERAQRKAIRAQLRDKYPDGIPKHVKVFAPRKDFTSFTMPRTPEEKRIDADEKLRHRKLLEVFNAPETLGDEHRAYNPLGVPKQRGGSNADASLQAMITPDLQRMAQKTLEQENRYRITNGDDMDMMPDSDFELLAKPDRRKGKRKPERFKF